MTKQLIGRNNTAAVRERIYESEDAIEVESNDQYELTRKSVLFEDIVMITYHRELGWPFVLAQTALLVMVLLVAGVTYGSGADVKVAAVIAMFAIPSLIALILRLSLQVDVVTIFGRRARAAIRFSFRKRRARELYGRLCARTRQVQREIEQTNRLAEPAQPPEELDPSLLPPG